MRENNSQQVRIWAMLCHLSALVWIPLAFFLLMRIPLYIPFLNILAPFTIWSFKKKLNPWIDFQGRESLNFQLSLAVYNLIIILILVLVFLITCVIAIAGFIRSYQIKNIFQTIILFFAIATYLMMMSQLIFVSVAAIKSYRGKYYRYPLTIRFLR
ncbi:DUF4870 domain-containing protein [Brunnivagina elsteri]|uniref:DUF4870 domain-containing protein n=1 Tax=Brunnivagina elsteri CCALA 953 TaxID=987040 RepID=A0A2A2TP94_9CYAN|nr:DUF4870 domain-containing protein [Calothrix elsteri]PAX60309.1 hypothetical protein CK510_02370 [Calothrix elsteri CCALA 953]